jgi:hypothetical protein
VAALAVGVVADDVEQRQRPKLIVEVLSHLSNREVVLGEVAGDKPLHRPFARRAITEHRRRDDPEAERFAHAIGRDLTTVQTRLEVPEGPLATHGLVDGRMWLAFVDHMYKECGIAAVWHPPFDLDLTVQQVHDGVVNRIDAEFDSAVFWFLRVRFRLVVPVIVSFNLVEGHVVVWHVN